MLGSPLYGLILGSPRRVIDGDINGGDLKQSSWSIPNVSSSLPILERPSLTGVPRTIEYDGDLAYDGEPMGLKPSCVILFRRAIIVARNVPESI